MENFDIHILGCGSALPTTRHNPSSQVISLRGKLYMIDCGEGTQLQMRRSQLNFNRLGHIFLSHLHGDHCFGLPGLISTMGLLGRTADLHIHAPAEYESMLQNQLDFFCSQLTFKVVFHPIDTTLHACIYEDRSVSVHSIPLKHRVPCCGFLFHEAATLPHIRRDMIDFYGIPNHQINNIKHGADWQDEEGNIIPNSRLTLPAAPPRSYAYCSDTLYLPSLTGLLKNVNLLYHEATFGSDQQKRARETRHSTAEQAAMIARDCGAKRLCIGHYSARYTDENILLEEARKVFAETVAAQENMILSINS
ncbi:MAG: ribonuclease Z [Clostridium sp.]|nr:ribonuclease Z [Clostridium sp.]